MKKKALLSILTLGILVSLATVATGSVSADDISYPPIVSQIAEKFGLKEEDVEAVFDAVHEERAQYRQQTKEERLSQAVEDGVLTEDQKNALLEKYNQMHQDREQERQQHKEEMDAWMNEQGIDHDALMEYANQFGLKGHGMKGMWKN